MAREIPVYNHLTLHFEDRTLVVTVSRPEAMNALNSEVIQEFGEMLAWVEERLKAEAASIRALIVTGAGEKAFIAGADIKQFVGMTPEVAAEFSGKGHAVFRKFETISIPVIAAVNGFALGGGLELALACDFIVAAENAKFGMPEVTLGLMPGFGGTVRLPLRVGVARARELSYLGTMISAQEAQLMGLVSRITTRAELLPTCLELASTIALRGPQAIARVKRSINEGMSLTEDEALRLEQSLFSGIYATDDAEEGVRAFIDKRKPLFTGK
jgi:enoyl-CoA hydratase